jgi:hypothetical protein
MSLQIFTDTQALGCLFKLGATPLGNDLDLAETTFWVQLNSTTAKMTSIQIDRGNWL